MVKTSPLFRDDLEPFYCWYKYWLWKCNNIHSMVRYAWQC